MAGSKLNDKVPASTIIEVVIAMVVIIIVFGIAMMIYGNVVKFSLSGKKLRAQAILRETLSKDEQNPLAIVSSFTADDFKIEQEKKTYNGDAGLTVVHLLAYDENQQVVAELQKIILTTP